MSTTFSADRLRSIMTSRGMNAFALVQRLRKEGLNLSDSYIYTILQGRNKTPSPATVWLLTHALGVPIWELAPYLDPRGQTFPQARQTAARIAEYQARKGLRSYDMAANLGMSMSLYNTLVSGGIKNKDVLLKHLAELNIPPQEAGFGLPLPDVDDFVETPIPAPPKPVTKEKENAPAPAPAVEIEVKEFVTQPVPPPSPVPPVQPKTPSVSAEPMSVTYPITDAPVPEFLEAAQWILQGFRAVREFLKTEQLTSLSEEADLLKKLTEALRGLFGYPAGEKSPQLMDALDIALHPRYDLDKHGGVIVRGLLALKGLRSHPSPVEGDLLAALTLALELREGMLDKPEDPTP